MKDDLTLMSETFTVRTIADGTTTRVEILDEFDCVIASGMARRAKGDARNPAYGRLLAASRAFRSLAAVFVIQAGFVK